MNCFEDLFCAVEKYARTRPAELTGHLKAAPQSSAQDQKTEPSAARQVERVGAITLVRCFSDYRAGTGVPKSHGLSSTAGLNVAQTVANVVRLVNHAMPTESKATAWTTASCT